MKGDLNHQWDLYPGETPGVPITINSQLMQTDKTQQRN